MKTDLPDNSPFPISSSNNLSVPRWVVYCQAILLGLIATTCFIAGIYVGSFGKANPIDESRELRVSGTINFADNNVWFADAGAVVLLLPDAPQNVERQDPTTLTPSFFQPLENPTINSVRQSGGNIVRANNEGRFELFVVPGVYNLLVISKARYDERPQTLSREQVAALSQYFLPVENLIVNQKYHWKTIQLTIKDIDVGTVEFE